MNRLRDIPDPFAEHAAAPVGANAPKGLPSSPTRAGVRSARIGAFGAALASQVIGLAVVRHGTDLGITSRAGLAAAFAIPLVATVVALAGAIRRGGLGLGESTRRLGALVGGSVAVFVAGTLLCAPVDTDGPRLWSHAAQCMAITCALAAVPIALGVWAFRRSFAVSSRWRGALVGTAAGGLAATTMSVLCATGGVVHVLFGHGIMLCVGALAGAVFGGKVMRA